MAHALFFVLLPILCAMGCYGASQSEAQPPNVVLILTDDLGYGDVSCYGQSAYETPHIDQLAREGVRATDFYVPVPYCAPSRAALLTGRFPFRNGMTRNPHPDETPMQDKVALRHSELTLGEIYKANGYKTICIGKWHLGHQPSSYPIYHGFDEYYGILYSNDMLPIQIIENTEVVENPVDQRYLTKKYTERAVDFISRNKENAFFLYLPHAMPHKPIAASDRFYTPDTPGDLYHDVIKELDWSVGEVVSALTQASILETTILIFMSDNGPHYGGSTGGLKGKKATPWEGGTRVPFIVRYPSALPKEKVVSTPMWSIDLFPTLLNLCGIDLPNDIVFDGTNIVDVLSGKKTTHSPIFSVQNEKIVTIRDGPWKLYLSKPRYLSARDLNPDWVDKKHPNGTTIIAQDEQPTTMQYPGIVPEPLGNDFPLFNLVRDPAESVDLAQKYPEVVDRLRAKYRRFLASMPPVAPPQ